MKMNNEEFVEDRHYKVQCGQVYYIRRKDIEYNGSTFCNYYIPCLKTSGGTRLNFNKKVRFKKGVELKDNTQILIINMFEDVMKNPKDAYNPIWHLMITDFEVVEEPDDTTDAIMDYQNNLELEKNIERENDDLITF